MLSKTVPAGFVALIGVVGRTSWTCALTLLIRGAACPRGAPAFWLAMAQMAVKMGLARLVPPTPISRPCMVPEVSTMGTPV